MNAILLEQLPRFISLVFSVYCLGVVATRWRTTRILSQDKRFLLLFFILECGTVMTSSILKINMHVGVDVATWLTVQMQAFLAAYLHYSIPPEYRRFIHRFTRRR